MSQSLYDLSKSRQEDQILKAAAARSKGDVVRVKATSAGLVDATLADDTDLYRVAVASKDVASADYAPYVTKGPVYITVASGNYTAGHGVKILDGAVASTGATAAQPGSGEASTSFGVILIGGTSVTSIEVLLYGDVFTATT